MELRADLPDCPARLVADVESDFIIGNAMADVDIDIYGSLRVTRYSSLIFNDLSRKAQTVFNFFRSDMKIVAGTTGVPEEPTGQE